MTVKRKTLLVLLPVLTILSGFLPNAVRMNWMNGSGETLYTYYPYAHFLPAGYAHFTPILTVLSAGILLTVILFWLFLGEGWTAVRIMSAFAAGMAVCAFTVSLVRSGYFSALGLLIAVLLLVEAVSVFTVKIT